MSIRYTLREVREQDLLDEINGTAEPNYDNLKPKEMCITEDGKVFVRLKDGTIREFTEAAAEYARQILNQITQLGEDIQDTIENAQMYSSDQTEQIVNLASQTATLKNETETLAGEVETLHGQVITAKNSVDASETAALNAKNDAIDYANLAEKWANYMEGKVDGNEYSAKYYAEQLSNIKDYVDQKATEVSEYAVSAQDAADNAQNITNLFEVSNSEIDEIVGGD